MSDDKPNDGKPGDGKPGDGFPFELNGEKLFAPSEKLRPLQILEIAWEMKILPFEPAQYRLVLSKDGTVYKDDDYIDLTVDNDFIAQPTTPGTVAQDSPHVVITG